MRSNFAGRKRCRLCRGARCSCAECAIEPQEVDHASTQLCAFSSRRSPGKGSIVDQPFVLRSIEALLFQPAVEISGAQEALCHTMTPSCRSQLGTRHHEPFFLGLAKQLYPGVRTNL